MANRITTLFDLDAKGFDSGLKKLRGEVAKADGVVNKLKTAGSGLGTILQDNIANAALAAGAALVAFGVKSVQAFQDTALAAGQFADATGASVESASRWIEVAGDFGIEAGAVEGAMRKMNLAIANGKPVMDDFGDAIVRTKDGTVDSAATFENLITRIGAIKDPTERAKAAQEAFGKSYGDVARFMEMSATDLAAALGNVSEQKVIDQAELEKARQFQARMDELKDRLDDVALAVGEAVVPVLSDLADMAGVAADAVKMLNIQLLKDGEESVDLFSSWGDMLGYYKKQWNDVFNDESQAQLKATADGTAELSEAMGMVESRVSDADYSRMGAELADIRASAQGSAEAFDDLEESTAALDDTYSAFLGKLDQQDAWNTFFEKMYQYHSETGRSEQETRDYARAIGEMVMALEGVPPETKAQMIATLDAGNIAAIESRLNQLARNRVVSISGQLVGSGLRNEMEGRATGGPVTAGTPYLVGERGPEIVVPGRSGTVIPNNRIGVGGGINVAIYPKTLPTDRELIDLVTNLRRRNGGVI